jgi:hypothetical protein
VAGKRIGRNQRRNCIMGERPAHVVPPAHLTPTVPVPVPQPAPATRDPDGQDPTRYGDWESKGIAIDF